MRPVECLSLMLSGQEVDRVPFVPAIYEHKAFLINETPSKVVQDQDLLVRALEAEYAAYQADLLVVGIDLYNVEAEAVGAKVKYFESNEVPSVNQRPLDNNGKINDLKVPNPKHNGRMPLMIDAGREIARRLGSEVMVWGGISGPFSLASQLLQADKLLLMTISDPNFVQDLMEFSTKVIIEYGKAWMDAGLGVIVFDSFCSPPLISPQSYRQLVSPYQTELMNFLKKAGLNDRPLIIGGNTTDIAEDIAKTGANFILCDYNANLEYYLRVAVDTKIALRANLNPELVYRGPISKITQAGKELVRKANTLSRFILGTGVLPYDTPREHVLALKECVK